MDYEDIKRFKGKNMVEYVAEKIAKTRSDYRDQCSEYGYYPLGYYEKNGYDIAAIKEHCMHKREHPFLGMTYRVDIDKGREGQLNERVRTSDMGTQPGLGGTAKAKAKAKGKAKAKANPNAKAEKVYTTNLSAAEKAQERIGVTFQVMHGFFEGEGKIDPQVVGQWVVDAYKELEQVKSAAEITIRANGQISFPYTTKQVASTLKEANNAKRVVDRFILERFKENSSSPKKDPNQIEESSAFDAD